MGKPIQYILCGYPFSGKTTLAKLLKERLGFARVNIDEIKFEAGFEDVSDDDVPDEQWHMIFSDSDKRVLQLLREGKNVLNETAWTTKKWRDRARSVAHKAGFETKVLFVDVSLELARERWLKNKTTNQRFDIPEKIFEESVLEFEKPTEEENVVVFKEEDNIEDWINKNL